MISPVVLDRCESWDIKKAVVLEKTLESPLVFKVIKPVHPKGNQNWMFIGRADAEAEAPILWPPDKKSWLMDRDAGTNGGQKEKGISENEMVT